MLLKDITSKSRPAILSPLQIKCTDSICEDGLHCFLKSKKMKIDDKGKCRSCGIDLIDWSRVHKKNIDDVIFTFNMLKKELVRHVYWHTKIDQKAINHALRKGRMKLRVAAEKRIRKYIANKKNFREGIQTPKDGNIIFYSQHATPCCCRKCMEYWHGIPQNTLLTEEQIQYFVELMMLYINDRLKGLSENGIYVPRIVNN